jgi:hypothetical protein
MNSELEIRVAEEFSTTLGARYKYEGKFSGEAFLEEHLYPKFQVAQKNKQKLKVFLDGVFGYPSSFVSGSFGKLAIEFGADLVIKTIELITDNPIRKEKIEQEIKNPKNK